MTTTIKKAAKASVTITNVRVLDPAQGLDTVADVAIEKGVIRAIAPRGLEAMTGEVIEGEGKLLLPGFVDLHTHLRTPGREDEEDIASGTAAAAAGGYVTICAMPNTYPVVDNAAVLGSLLETAEKDALVRVAFLGAISAGQKGEHLSDMWDLSEAGAVAFSDDGRPVASGGLLRSALQAAKLVDLPLSLHAEDQTLAAGGSIHEGELSARLGLTGIPATAETGAIARDLEIAAWEQGRVHIAHVSCGRSLELIAAARQAGLAVTCEVTPHHLLLDDSDVATLDANFKMNPPLRSAADRAALVEGLKRGVIDCIATDHAPHAPHEKEVPFEEAAFGIVGLETAFAVLYTGLVETGEVPLAALVEAMSTRPARIFSLPEPAIAEGEEANLCLVDAEAEYEIDPRQFRSKSRNTPFAGRRVKGRVLMTIAAGRVAYKSKDLSS